MSGVVQIVATTSGQLWQPRILGSSLALWLDAADATTITLNGSTVSQWRDKSGNLRHVSQETAANQPIYSTTAFNNRPSLVFDGTNDFLNTTSAALPTGATSRSIFAVYQPNRTTLANAIVGQSNDPAVAGDWFLLSFRSASPAGDPYFAGGASVADVADGQSPTLTAKIAGVTYNGSTVVLYKNASQIASENRSLNTISSELAVGASRNGTAARASMNFSEMIYLASTVSTFARHRIEGYLAHKWGLMANLPANHPFKNAIPTF